MPRLQAERELPLKPYTPKPGDGMDTHATVSLRRDGERKRIVLSFSTIQIRGNMTGFRLSGPNIRITFPSPTHKPKEFAALEAKHMGEIDSQQGETWDTLVNMLAEHGMELAATMPATV